MAAGLEMAPVGPRGMQGAESRNGESIARQVFAPSGLMALEHARQSVWEQSVVGALCAVGGSLLAYWSLQGFVGLAVITLCVAFSTLVTAALCHYYDDSTKDSGKGAPRSLPPGESRRVNWSASE